MEVAAREVDDSLEELRVFRKSNCCLFRDAQIRRELRAEEIFRTSCVDVPVEQCSFDDFDAGCDLRNTQNACVCVNKKENIEPELTVSRPTSVSNDRCVTAHKSMWYEIHKRNTFDGAFA